MAGGGGEIPSVDVDGTHRWRPSARLREHVTSIWAWRHSGGPPGTHNGVPSAHLTVVICLDGDVELISTPAHPTRSPGRYPNSVGGLHDRPVVMTSGAAQTGMQLELSWRGTRTLLGLPAAELSGDVVDLSLLVPGLDALVDRLRATPSWPGRFALLDAELCRLLDLRESTPTPAPEIGRAWDELVRTGGTARITELAADVGWSRRHLGERFRTETGLGTKTAARLIRFERACALLRRPDGPGLAEVAALCGYADQPHLARDFRDLAGLTATAWKAERPS